MCKKKKKKGTESNFRRITVSFLVSFAFSVLQRACDRKPSCNSPHILMSRLPDSALRGAGVVFAG